MISKILRITWIPVVLILLYSGWLMWRRHQSAVFRKPVLVDRDAYGTELKILTFYTRSDAIARGEKALVCYGVVNAASVRLDPPDEDVWPSLSRCFEVGPARTTRYTLTAESADHRAVSAAVEVKVR